MTPEEMMRELGFPQDQIDGIRSRLSDAKLLQIFSTLTVPAPTPLATRFYNLALQAMGPLPGSSSNPSAKVVSDARPGEDARRRKEIWLILDAEGPQSTKQLYKAIGGRKAGLIAVLNIMVQDGELSVTPGRGRAKIYSITSRNSQEAASWTG